MGIVKTEFVAVEFAAVKLIGKEITVSQGKTAAKSVAEFRKNGENERLQNHPDRVSPKGDIIIWMGDYNAQTKSFIEIPGIFASTQSEVPDGFVSRQLPACTMGVFTITGTTRDISRSAHNKLVRAAAENGYAPDYSFGYSMEYYSYEKYEKGETEFVFAYYLPCRAISK